MGQHLRHQLGRPAIGGRNLRRCVSACDPRLAETATSCWWVRQSRWSRNSNSSCAPGAASVQADLQTVAVTSPFGVLSMFIGSDGAAWNSGRGQRSRPTIAWRSNFPAPRALHTAARRDNVVRLRALADPARRPPVVARAWTEAGGEDLAQRAVMLRRAGAYEPAYDAALDAINKAPDRTDALQALVEAAAATGRQADAASRLERDSRTAPGPGCSARRPFETAGRERCIRRGHQDCERRCAGAPR